MCFRIVEHGPEAFSAPNLVPSCAIVAQVCLRVEGEESRRLADCKYTYTVLSCPTSEHIPEGTVPTHSLELVFISFEICMWNAVFGVGLFSPEMKALEAAWANICGVLNLVLNLWRKKRNWIVIARDDVMTPPQAPCCGGHSGLPGWLPVPGLGGRGWWAHHQCVKQSSTSLISSVLEIKMEWVLSLPLLYKPYPFSFSKIIFPKL